MKKIENLSAKALLRILRLTTILQCLFYLTIPTKVYAANALQGTALYKGAINLLNDGTTLLLALEAVIVVAMEIVAGIKYQTGEIDEKKLHKKEAKSILMVGILIISATTVLKVIFSYFQ